jgi:hypothetical protein
MEAAVPSVAVSATKTRYIRKRAEGAAANDDTLMEVTTVEHPPGLHIDGDRGTGPAPPAPLPVLSSACPGFVCLVEKTAPAAVPLLATAKSPTAVAGTLLKAGARGRDGAANGGAEACYHVAIEPCHDKKVSGPTARLRMASLRRSVRVLRPARPETSPPLRAASPHPNDCSRHAHSWKQDGEI